MSDEIRYTHPSLELDEETPIRLGDEVLVDLPGGDVDRMIVTQILGPEFPQLAVQLSDDAIYGGQGSIDDEVRLVGTGEVYPPGLE